MEEVEGRKMAKRNDESGTEGRKKVHSFQFRYFQWVASFSVSLPPPTDTACDPTKCRKLVGEFVKPVQLNSFAIVLIV